VVKKEITGDNMGINCAEKARILLTKAESIKK